MLILICVYRGFPVLKIKHNGLNKQIASISRGNYIESLIRARALFNIQKKACCIQSQRQSSPALSLVQDKGRRFSQWMPLIIPR
ncbi:Uncharacterised protein [Legionella pneumophila]|nr:hypothetical protein ULM_12130 [Legionella pneumophila]CZH21492.1 Uncharacterised protein [Legionella pneumophila]CZH60959.1 Uncharacterised protein [Legionella pneumophila]CZH63851.1 Uncharacterised protein [Legionella pneumophila]CZH64050.1 Uncharacterised protein [Legionella pneumophila]